VVYSPRLDAHVQFGRLPDDRRRARVTLRRALGAEIIAPPSADWISEVPSWNMALNDQLGSCTVAGMGHEVTSVVKYGQHQDSVIPDDETLLMYEAISGYRPGHPETDAGATLQSALSYMRKVGMNDSLGQDRKVVAFAQIDPYDLELVRTCIAYFGAVYTGMIFPQSAMDEFNQHKPWTNVRSSGPILGGHCVPIMSYSATSFTCVTWAQPQTMSVDFYKLYFDEIWVPVFPEWMEASGTTPSGLDAAAANADFQALTGSSDAPFGDTPPPPAPAPTPTPDPSNPGCVCGFLPAVKKWFSGA
jgi:hypothetical protein